MRTVDLQPRSGATQVGLYVGEQLGDAWFWMLGLGIIHHHVHQVPAFGFGLTLLLWFLLGSSGMMRTPSWNELNTRRKVKH